MKIEINDEIKDGINDFVNSSIEELPKSYKNKSYWVSILLGIASIGLAIMTSNAETGVMGVIIAIVKQIIENLRVERGQVRTSIKQQIIDKNEANSTEEEDIDYGADIVPSTQIPDFEEEGNKDLSNKEGA